MTTNHYLTIIAGATAALLLAWGGLSRARRAGLWLGAIGFGAAAGSVYYDSFWAFVVFALLGFTGFFQTLHVIDGGWRARFSLVFGILVIAGISLWPSFDLPGLTCPDYLKAPRPAPAEGEDPLPPRVNFKLGRGLDLRGGLRLVYTVDVSEAIKDRRDHYYEEIRTTLAKQYGFHEGNLAPSEDALKKLREKVVVEAPHDRADTILLTFAAAADVDKQLDARFRERFAGDLGMPSIAGAKVTYTVRENAATAIRERAVGQAKEIILRRVDEMGLKEAAVSTRSEDIIVEVPGEDEASFDEIRDIISRTARLEFKLLDDETDYFKEVAQKYQGKDDQQLARELPAGLRFAQERVPLGLDSEGETILGLIHYVQLDFQAGETAAQALERFKAWTGGLTLPPDREVGFGVVEEVVDEVTLEQKEVGWRTYFLKSRAEITGDMIRDATHMPDMSQGGMGEWFVSLTFTEQGGSIFGRITGANVKKRFAIILDDRVESAPQILTAITGGQARITMGGGDQEAQRRDARQLELVLRSGALPAPISPSNEQRIGPSLGKDAIDLGMKGGLVGAVLVLAFMWIYYQGAGLVANAVVIVNLFLQLAVLASFSASMTLPGIAGLTLVVGMAVDNNVLINERIREEQAAGKSPRAAVEIGFNRALSAIIDGQLTTLISGVVLAQYGSGPIKGFAVTLIVGTLCSIFCGVVVSRLIFDFWVRRLGRQAKLNMG